MFAYLQENVSISVEQTDKFQTLITVISLLLRHPGGLCLFVPMHCDQDLLGTTFTHAQSHGQPIHEQNLTIKVSGYWELANLQLLQICLKRHHHCLCG